MPDADRFAALLLEQAPACAWVVTKEGRFERVYGDSTGIFGKPAQVLTGETVGAALGRKRAMPWNYRFFRAFQGEAVSVRERGAGNAVWNISIFPVHLDGIVEYAGAMAREVSGWNKAEQELRQTVLGALKSQEFERKMAAKFLHDAVGQNLTALGLQLDLIRMDLEAVLPGACERVSEVQKVLEIIMEDVREYSYELNPSTVERAGLRSALDRLMSRMRDRFNGSIRLNLDPSLKLDPKISPALYQIAQEAVENAVVHAGCSVIEIAVKSTRNGPSLEVRDNGRGFDPADLMAGRRGLGLLSMEHYAAQAGLDLSILSIPDSGTTVRAASEPP